MHNIGTVPTFKIHNTGAVPTFKMYYNIGTVPAFKMHNIEEPKFFYDSLFLYKKLHDTVACGSVRTNIFLGHG